jgi:RNase P subunit RPR2
MMQAMKILKIGDKEQAICNTCQALVGVTYQLRDVPFNDQSGVVKDILVGVCENCDTVAVLPHQSTPKVKQQLAKQRDID